MWEKVIQLINYYHNSLSAIPRAEYLMKIGNDTLYDFASHSADVPALFYNGKAFNRDEMRQIFAFVRDHNYPYSKCFMNALQRK